MIRSFQLFFSFIAVLSVVSSRPGRAESPTERIPLAWKSPDDCATSERILRELKTMLGSDWAGDVKERFEGAAVKDGNRWRISLRVRSGEDEYARELTVNTCDAVVKVVAMLIALSINPSLALSTDDENLQSSLKVLEGADTTDAQAAPDPQNDLTDQERGTEEIMERDGTTRQTPAEEKATKEGIVSSSQGPAPQNMKPVAYAVGLSFVADLGTAAIFGPGLSVEGAVWIKWARIELAAWYVAPQESDIEESETGVFKAQLVGGALGVGGHFRIGRFNLDPLVGLSIHSLFAQSLNIVTEAKENAMFFSAWSGVAFEWLATEWLGIGFHPAIHYFFSRPEFRIEPYGRVHKPSVVAGVIKIGVFVHF